MKQRTLGKVVSTKGIGLHTGAQVEVVLRPAVADSGLTVRRMDGDKPLDFTVSAEATKGRVMSTYLEDSSGNTVTTVEHLVSALHALGVDNVEIEVAGPEVPILDGSALPWVELIDEAGRVELDKQRNWLKILKTVTLDEGGRVLMAEADARAGVRVECHVDFPHPMIGKQSWQGVVNEEIYRREIAPARTFVMEKDVEAARNAGLIKGGSLENAVVFGEDGTVKNLEGLRFSDEPVRHKVLDVMGDFYMNGQPLWGRLTLTAPGHTVNNQLLRKIVKSLI